MIFFFGKKNIDFGELRSNEIDLNHGNIAHQILSNHASTNRIPIVNYTNSSDINISCKTFNDHEKKLLKFLYLEQQKKSDTKLTKSIILTSVLYNSYTLSEEFKGKTSYKSLRHIIEEVKSAEYSDKSNFEYYQRKNLFSKFHVKEVNRDNNFTVDEKNLFETLFTTIRSAPSEAANYSFKGKIDHFLQIWFFFSSISADIRQFEEEILRRKWTNKVASCYKNSKKRKIQKNDQEQNEVEVEGEAEKKSSQSIKFILSEESLEISGNEEMNFLDLEEEVDSENEEIYNAILSTKKSRKFVRSFNKDEICFLKDLFKNQDDAVKNWEEIYSIDLTKNLVKYQI